MDRYQYLLLMAVCALGTLPLEWAFRARVYRRAPALVRTLWLPVLAFCVWDGVAISRGHWTFAARYTTGWTLPFDIPIEELAFFIVIPICALLSFEACARILER
ncbi:MAG: lycopene beta-cyclase [Acidimicrobiaceae bacterium]|jgi:lycopene cyclase domain-containing protein